MATEDAAYALRQLQENTPLEFLNVSEILLKYINNIIRHPRESKYRSVRLGNKVFANRVLPISGGIECLFAAGFDENDEYLTLPSSASLKALEYLQRELGKERLKLLSQQVNNLLTTGTKEHNFLQRLKSSSNHVMIYEDVSLQQKALSVIPVMELNTKAERRHQGLNQSEIESPLDVRDCLLLELLKWFKTRFFKWMNSPKCDHCGGTTQNIGMVEPTSEDLRYMAHSVEAYRCSACSRVVRYPRYNHPGKLLETRSGRCGEWANCFTLCCRAMGYEARYVLDWTDHVWTEVFSVSQQRWFHCDACENICDKPLLYENGWGKKLSYIIAFSCVEVVDVTWRYTSNPQGVISRRTECREEWLMDAIQRLMREKQVSVSLHQRQLLESRQPLELAEFLSSKTSQSGDDQGRQSGSLAWRLNRGETHQGTSTAAGGDLNESYTFKPSILETESGIFHLKYNCASNKYVRVSSNNEEVEDWESRVFTQENIFKKEENDWEMTYLAREEGTSEASISWKFDCSNSDRKIDKIFVRASSETFQSGQIRWTVCAANQTVRLNGGNYVEELSEFRGAETLVIKAELSGGNGDVAWQHTQLFRQKMDDLNDFPFDLKILLVH